MIIGTSQKLVQAYKLQKCVFKQDVYCCNPLPELLEKYPELLSASTEINKRPLPGAVKAFALNEGKQDFHQLTQSRFEAGVWLHLDVRMCAETRLLVIYLIFMSCSSQTHVMELIRELGLEVFPQYTKGKKVHHVGGPHAKIKMFTTSMPSYSPLNLLDFTQILRRV